MKKLKDTIIYHGFAIRLWKKRKRYKVDRYISAEQRIQKTFPTLAKAKLFAEQKDIELTNKGHDALNVSDKTRMDAMEAEKLLAGKASLVETARYYMKHEHPAGLAVTVSALVEQYIQSMIAEKAREHSVKGFAWRARAFCRAHGQDSIHRISRADIVTWLNNNGWQGLNRRHYIATVHALFNFAIGQDILDANPADKIELPTVESKEPVILSAADIRTLLHKAAETEPAIVPALAVSFFAGVRPVELSHLNWSAVHLDGAEPVIHIGADVAKKRHRRNVDISSNLTVWLTAYRKPEGNVMLTPSNHRRHLARLIKATGIKMPYNAGRHAFSSYAYVKHGAEKTARWLGHADGELLLTTYKGLVSQSDADIFWSIKPKELEKSNVIQFNKAAGA